jgi:hypothetical protein
VLGYVPWLILLACPLMHVFMHRGHGHKGSQGPGQDPGARMRNAAGDRDE